MSSPATKLQVRSEIAEDVIGAYIGRLSAELTQAEKRQQEPASVQLLATIHWLKTELRDAGIDRATLFEHQSNPDGFEALIVVYRQKLAAITMAMWQGAGAEHATEYASQG
jgi:hypothetical protein